MKSETLVNKVSEQLTKGMEATEKKGMTAEVLNALSKAAREVLRSAEIKLTYGLKE